jgi:hypothetical protein
MAKKKQKAFWERGYNGHVFWLGKTKLGKARKAVEFAVHVKDKQLDLFG